MADSRNGSPSANPSPWAVVGLLPGVVPGGSLFSFQRAARNPQSHLLGGRRMKRFLPHCLSMVFVACFLCPLGGCLASGIAGAVGTAVAPAIFTCGAVPHGHSLDPSIVNSIKDGDSRSQVEKKLGEPDFVDVTRGGVCQVSYMRNDVRPNPMMMMPIIQFFVSDVQKVRIQKLCITYKDDLVQEHEFSDTTARTTGGIMDMQTRQAPTPGAQPLPPRPTLQQNSE